MKYTWLYIVLAIVLSSCEKEDVAVVLPPPGDLTKVEANIGEDYLTSVYVSLANNTQKSAQWKNYDLAFEASENGMNIYLNTGKLMFACKTGTTDFASADSTGKEWRIDNDQLQDDSNAFASWWTRLNGQEVMVVDRGRIYYIGGNAVNRFKKLKVEQVNSDQYVISFGSYNSTTPTEFTITKDHNRSLVYFSFDNGGQLVDMEPPKEEWDFVLTRYTHIYYGEPITSVFRYYLVNGGISNKWNGITGCKMIKDVTPGYIPFEEMTASNAINLDFSADANTIGFDWKLVDTNTGIYTIVPDIYYLLKDKNGYLYKIRFLNFYTGGQKGNITLDYQRL